MSRRLGDGPAGRVEDDDVVHTAAREEVRRKLLQSLRLTDPQVGAGGGRQSVAELLGVVAVSAAQHLRGGVEVQPPADRRDRYDDERQYEHGLQLKPDTQLTRWGLGLAVRKYVSCHGEQPGPP